MDIEKFEKIYSKDYYKSILNLTFFFNIEKEIHIRQLHYRWALIKDHDNIEATYFVKQMKKYYLDDLYFFGYIVKDCITSNNNLTNFLSRLVDKYELLKPLKKNGIVYYNVTEESQKLLLQHHIMDKVKKMSRDKLEKFYLKFIYNIDRERTDKEEPQLTDKDVKEFITILEDREKNLRKKIREELDKKLKNRKK